MCISDLEAITKQLQQMNYPTFVTRWWYEQHSTTALQRVHRKLVMETQYNVHKKKCSQ